MTSFISSGKPTISPAISSRTTNRVIFAFMLAMLGLMLFGAPLSAQTYSCFPTCSSTDARFLTIAGTGYNTLINSEIVMKIGSPGVATSVEIGIFDGETGGLWDAGTTPLTYRLYADPTGEGTGTTLVTTFAYSQMLDNAWKSFTVTNVAAARAPNGNYLYRLVITSTSLVDSYWSSFKVRTTGTVALKAQAFSVAATARTDQDLNIIYPAGQSNLTNTTYDGSWRFFLDVQNSASTLSVWDGDMDFGTYDCTTNDNDDPNTSNLILPPWASPVSASLEGVGFGNPCVGGGGNSTGTPPDDNRYPLYRRSPVVTYDVITPQGQRFSNNNPSGSREWEEYKLTTAAHNANVDDAHADSLTSGIYEVRVTGMDLDNLNGWRFFSDAIGVDTDGDPTPPLRPYTISGTICYEAPASSTSGDDDDDNDSHSSCRSNDDDDDNGSHSSSYSSRSNDDDDDNGSTRCTRTSHSSCTHNNSTHNCGSSSHGTSSHNCSGSHDNDDDDDNGTTTPSGSTCGSTIENVRVVLTGDVNGDNVTDVNLTTTTNSTGVYTFPVLLAGSYRVTVVTSTLPSGSTAVTDYDGIATPNVAAVVIPSGAPNPGNVFFRYRLGSTTGTNNGGVRSQGYWKTHSSNWPSTSIMVGCTTYTRAQAIDRMDRSVSGDKTYSMFKQLTAAKLNVAAGARSSCILSIIASAETWLCTYRLGSNVSGSSNAWRNSGSALHDALEQYNTGHSCAAHVD